MNTLRRAVLYSLLFAWTILLISCGDDDIVGCTNSLANNFNSEATVDDGSCIITGCTNPEAENFNPSANQDADCVFARDKFIGNYTGSVNCSIIDQFNGTTTTVLLEPVESSVSELTISLETEAILLPIDAVVDGNSFDMTLEDFSLVIDFQGVSTPILLDIEGSGTISDNEQDINGDFLAIVLNPLTGAELLRDGCSFSATRN